MRMDEPWLCRLQRLDLRLKFSFQLPLRQMIRVTADGGSKLTETLGQRTFIHFGGLCSFETQDCPEVCAL